VRHLVKEATESFSVGVVDVFPWSKFSLPQQLPFGAQWYSLPPSSTSARDCHPEVELSVVISGTASVEASGEITDVAAGESFLLGSEEAHFIHNRSADQPLMVFTTYWMPLDNRAGPDVVAPDVVAPDVVAETAAPAQS
jgi:mannose-6-phosphate isomerase-like protein (cupin superfamily)